MFKSVFEPPAWVQQKLVFDQNHLPKNDDLDPEIDPKKVTKSFIERSSHCKCIHNKTN